MRLCKELKKQNKWTLLIAGLVICMVACFSANRLMAAQGEEKESSGMEYLNPFDLTVSSIDFLDTVRAPQEAPVAASSDASSVSAPPSVPKPVMIWIPYRPTFRSPCVPSI